MHAHKIKNMFVIANYMHIERGRKGEREGGRGREGGRERESGGGSVHINSIGKENSSH